MIEVPTMGSLADIDWISDKNPYETTILTFHHLLWSVSLVGRVIKT